MRASILRWLQSACLVSAGACQPKQRHPPGLGVLGAHARAHTLDALGYSRVLRHELGRERRVLLVEGVEAVAVAPAPDRPQVVKGEEAVQGRNLTTYIELYTAGNA